LSRAEDIALWIDSGRALLSSKLIKSARRADIQEGQPFTYLALSGGDGAYGARILTESGTRPEFTSFAPGAPPLCFGVR
jgi:hypothetical protein